MNITQDKLILTYTIIYTIIYLLSLSVNMLKKYKIKDILFYIYIFIIFGFGIGFTIYFYLILFCSVLQIFLKNNYLIIQILLNVPMVILTYKIFKD